MLEKELEIEILQQALATPLKRAGEGGSIGSIYDNQGQPHLKSLLKRSYKQIQFAEKNYQPDAKTAKVRVKKAIYGGRIVPHYGHFLLETLARAWAFNKYPEEDVYFHLFTEVEQNYSLSNLKSWQQELLFAALIKPERIHFITELTYFDELIVPEAGYVISDYCHPQQAQALTGIGQRLKSKVESASVPKKIWLSRSGLKKARIAGEEDFENALQQEGFEIVYPEKLPIGEQVQIFEGKNIIAGFTGSAFHTLVLAESKETKVLHFSRIPNVSSNYQTCAQAKGIKAEYYDFFVKKGKQKAINGNVIQDLEKTWQVLHQQGLVKTEHYYDSDLELKLQELDEKSEKTYQKIKKIVAKQSNNKSAKKLFIHVGSHKTGSSFIQSCLAKNTAILESYDIKYPFFKTMENAANGFISSGNGRLLLEGKSILSEDSLDKSLLFSGENLYLYLITPRHLKILSKLQQKFDIQEISILLFIRDPIEHASSFYQQEIKRGGATFSIEEYFESYDYPIKIEKFLTTAAKIKDVSVHVFNYSVVKDKLITIVEQWLGIPENSLSPPEINNVNRSLTFAELEFQRYLNATISRPAIVSDSLCNQLPNIKADSIIPAVEVQKALLERLQATIDNINAMIPSSQHYRCHLLPESTSENPQLVFNKEQLHIIVESLGGVINKLSARNEVLQAKLKTNQEN
jgi:capsular polysaccharide biosynthesis protein